MKFSISIFFFIKLFRICQRLQSLQLSNISTWVLDSWNFWGQSFSPNFSFFSFVSNLVWVSRYIMQHGSHHFSSSIMCSIVQKNIQNTSLKYISSINSKSLQIYYEERNMLLIHNAMFITLSISSYINILKC